MPHAAATFQTSTIMFSISFNILGDKHKKKSQKLLFISCYKANAD